MMALVECLVECVCVFCFIFKFSIGVCLEGLLELLSVTSRITLKRVKQVMV